MQYSKSYCLNQRWQCSWVAQNDPRSVSPDPFDPSNTRPIDYCNIRPYIDSLLSMVGTIDEFLWCSINILYEMLRTKDRHDNDDNDNDDNDDTPKTVEI